MSLLTSQRVLAVLGLIWLALAGLIARNELSSDLPIRITWATETELETAGFNVLRADSADGEYSQINPNLIPSRGDPITGATYEFLDDNVTAGRVYYYRLEEVELNNSRNLQEIFASEQRQARPSLLALALGSAIVGIVLIAMGLRPEKKHGSEPET